MKKLFLASVVFAVFVSPANSFDIKSDPTLKTRTVAVKEKITRIVLNGDADVVFVKDHTGDITIEERTAIENSVKIKNFNGVLTIESRNFYKGKKPLLLIPASQLQSLELNGDGSVATASMLQSKELNVFINGDCKVQIITAGKVSFESSPDYHLKFKKQTKRI